jgi:polysaccharide biosynthesis/export protein
MAKTVIGSTFGRIAGVALAATAMLSGPGASAGTKPVAATVAELNRDLPTSYRITPGDRLKVTVFDEANLTGEYLVGLGGELSMPLLGSIDTRDLQGGALAETIAGKLKDGGYVLAPRVSVEILSHRPFYILGEVNKPGEYPHASGMTLEQAVALAGGYTRRADTKSIVLKRSNWGQSERVRLDKSALQIAPGDTITVRESFF